MKRSLEHLVSHYSCVLFLLFAAWYGVVIHCPTVFAEEMSPLTGRVADGDGRAVEGARVYVYRSADVKGPANYMSSPTDKDGSFRMVVPAGRYWAVARLKKAENYGPLMPGDRHSGDPVEVEAAPGTEVTVDFVVADLREAIKIKTKARERALRISGRILDEKGEPITGAYAIANRSERISGIPDYLSAWVDDRGRYTLYVPPGRYLIGGAVTFPPGEDYFIDGEITVNSDQSDVNIVKKSVKSK